MRPDFVCGEIAVMLGHAQQPFADACVLLAFGLLGQLCGAFEKRFRIDHDKLQIRFRVTDNGHSQTQFLSWFDDSAAMEHRGLVPSS